MAQNIAVQSLIKERERVIHERDAAIERFYTQITVLENVIESLSGKKVKEVEAEMLYDDTNPDYIRSSQEEI